MRRLVILPHGESVPVMQEPISVAAQSAARADQRSWAGTLSRQVAHQRMTIHSPQRRDRYLHRSFSRTRLDYSRLSLWSFRRWTREHAGAS